MFKSLWIVPKSRIWSDSKTLQYTPSKDKVLEKYQKLLTIFPDIQGYDEFHFYGHHNRCRRIEFRSTLAMEKSSPMIGQTTNCQFSHIRLKRQYDWNSIFLHFASSPNNTFVRKFSSYKQKRGWHEYIQQVFWTNTITVKTRFQWYVTRYLHQSTSIIDQQSVCLVASNDICVFRWKNYEMN